MLRGGHGVRASTNENTLGPERNAHLKNPEPQVLHGASPVPKGSLPGVGRGQRTVHVAGLGVPGEPHRALQSGLGSP